MSSIVTGENMILEVKEGLDYAPIGCATACSFAFSNELIGKTDRNAVLFRKYRVRMSDCTANVQGLVSLVTDTTVSAFWFLQGAIRRTEQDLRFRFTDEEGNTQAITGKFLVATTSLTGDVSAFSEFDISFQGTGGITLEPVAVDSPGTGPTCEVQPTLHLTLAEGDTTVVNATLIDPNAELLAVWREGLEFYVVTGTPVGRQVSFDETTGTITFDAGNPGNPGGEGVEVMWQITA